MTTVKTGADIFAQLIAKWSTLKGVQTRTPIFHVPGEGALELIEALERSPSLRLITCRHEGGMAYMAQAAGQLCDRPGICVVGRAPGALNAALALHTAATDAAPMILILGQASQRQSGREAFLGPEFHQALAPMAKWVGEITDAARIPEALQRAWSMAMSGQKGPVVLVVNEDIWHQETEVCIDLPAPATVTGDLSASQRSQIATALQAAQKPLVILGGTSWQAPELAALQLWAETCGLPLITSYRRRDLVAASSPSMCGELGIGADPALIKMIAEADLLLVLGMRLGEINTFGAAGFAGFGLLSAPLPRQKLIHIHPDITELNRVFHADLALCARPASAVEGQAPSPQPAHLVWRDRLRAARLAFTTGKPASGPIDLRQICQSLRSALPQDTVVTVGAGAYAHWPQRYFPHNQPKTCLGPKSGTMGYGLSAAIAASLVTGQRSLAFAGDGCFLMHAEELSTAVLYDLPVLVIVINNAEFGAIGASQERQFGRKTGVKLAPTDIAAMARAMGAFATRITTTEDFAPALQSALCQQGPALIEVITGPEALKP